jgi:hypothetical protein
MQAYSERIRVTAAAPGHGVWDSGWDYQSNIVRSSATTLDNRLLFSGANDYDLRLHVDQAFYETILKKPVHLRAAVALTLLDRPVTRRIEGWDRPQRTPDGAICTAAKPGNFVHTTCVTPFRKVDESMIRFQPLPSGTPKDWAILSNLGQYGRLGDKFSIWQTVEQIGGYPPPPEPYAIYVETRRAVAHFERVLDIDRFEMGVER